MLFKEKFPKQKTNDFAKLSVDENVAWELKRTGRFFNCDICRSTVTEFRDTSTGVEIPICSEECRKLFMEGPPEEVHPDEPPEPAAAEA